MAGELQPRRRNSGNVRQSCRPNKLLFMNEQIRRLNSKEHHEAGKGLQWSSFSRTFCSVAMGRPKITKEGRRFNGSIPVRLSLNLEPLDLYQNNVFGEIPSGLGLFTNLTELKLFSNRLTSTLLVIAFSCACFPMKLNSALIASLSTWYWC